MNEAASEDGLKIPWRVAREHVAHLNRWSKRLGPFGQHLLQVFSGVLFAGEEEGYFVVLVHRDDARGEHAGSLFFVLVLVLVQKTGRE